MTDRELPPDQAPAADLPVHARERLSNMRRTHFFSSDLSVNEFLLVKQAGFEPLGLVMGSSVYQVTARIPAWNPFDTNSAGQELAPLTQALYHARELAMTRMEEEAQALGADGVVGVRLDIDLHAWGQDVAEFRAVGTAVRHQGGESWVNHKGMPFVSDLSGQDFWVLLHAGYRPVGLVMGNCVFYVPPDSLDAVTGDARNQEVVTYTHALYDARELAIERLQAEAEDLRAEGVVGVEVHHEEYSWGATRRANQRRFTGEIMEFFVLGTAVVALPGAAPPPVPKLVLDGRR
jgi:uncharacterized protein YbjQ (UPF0145 family)